GAGRQTRVPTGGRDSGWYRPAGGSGRPASRRCLARTTRSRMPVPTNTSRTSLLELKIQRVILILPDILYQKDPADIRLAKNPKSIYARDRSGAVGIAANRRVQIPLKKHVSPNHLDVIGRDGHGTE